jgi:glucose-1-phosphate adenylyltransferase
MNSTSVLAIVLAGGQGVRLRPLTAGHAKPALPFANGCRIIDFVLSNLVNSDISPIYVVAQFKPDSLVRHIDRVWGKPSCNRDCSVNIVVPRTEADRYLGTTHAVFRNLDLIERHRPDLVAVLAADHVYRMDIRQMVNFHVGRDADVSVAAVPVPIAKAASFGVLASDRDGRISDLQEKPQRPVPLASNPDRAYASMGNYLFNTRVLVDALCRRDCAIETDFGKHLLPQAVRSRRVFAYDFSTNHVPGVQAYEERAYWRDVPSLDAYTDARLDVLGARPRFRLQNPHWPIQGDPRAPGQRAPTKSNGRLGELVANPVTGSGSLSVSVSPVAGAH